MKTIILFIGIIFLFSCKKDSSTPTSNSQKSGNLTIGFTLTSYCLESCNLSINGTPYPFNLNVSRAGQTNYPQPNSQGIVSLPYVKSGDVVSIGFNDTSKSASIMTLVIENTNGIEGQWSTPWNLYQYTGNVSSNAIDSNFFGPVSFNLNLTIP